MSAFIHSQGDVMGFLHNLVHEKQDPGRAAREGQRRWRELFGQDKETGGVETIRPNPVRGGSYGRSSIAEPEAFKRLLQAMRSLAPGGWSDDRWEETKHYVGIQYMAIHRIGEQLSQTELEIFQKDPSFPEGERAITREDPPQGDRIVRPWDLMKLLKYPNNDDSWGDLMYWWNQQLSLTGMALTWMVPNQLGTPMELYSIPTAIAIPQPAINPDYPDGYWRIQPLYPYGPFSSYPTPATAVGAPIPAQWMIRMKMPHPLLRYDGYAPMTAMRLHIDEVEQMDRSRFYSMKRQINPSAVLNFDELENQMPLPEAEIERIRAEFENTFQGPEQSGQLFVATPGAKLEPWGMTPKEMEYYQSWEQLVSFVMAAFGITKPAAGMIEDSSYATLFATLKQLNLLTLDPLCNRISSQLNKHLAPFFGDNLEVRIRARRIDDHDVNKIRADTLVQSKAGTKNEIRTLCEMPPTKEVWGNDVAGDPSPNESAQMQNQMQQESAMADGDKEHETGMEKMKMDHEDNQSERQRIHDAGMGKQELEAKKVDAGMKDRPKTGSLGRGALGPRKELIDFYDTKDFLGRVRNAMKGIKNSNGYKSIHTKGLYNGRGS